MRFYVYEHWRLDQDLCFYVGKGKCGRAHSRHHRSQHWNRIVKKLEREGSSYEVRIVIDHISEQDAFEIEKSRIAFWRSVGVSLANKTSGGEGVTGLVHSEQTKKLISLKKKGVPHRTKRKGVTPHNKGKPGPSGAAHPMFGRNHSDESRAKMSATRKGRPLTDKQKQGLSAKMAGNPPNNKGKPRSEAAREKHRATLAAKRAAILIGEV